MISCLQLTAGQQKTLLANKYVKELHPDSNISIQQIPALQRQMDAPWHLDRLDQPSLPLNGIYEYTLDGTGVNVYILDTVHPLPHKRSTGQQAESMNFSPCPSRKHRAGNHMQGIRKDHVEFQYSAANQAKGIKGTHIQHGQDCFGLPYTCMYASLRMTATGVQERGPCTATRCMVMTTQMIAMVTAHMLLG